MSAKLTSAQRAKILKAVLADTFKGRMEAIHAKENEIALAVYHDVFSADEIAMLNAAPEGWFDTSALLRVVSGGVVKDLGVRLPVRMPFKKRISVLKVYEATSPMAERITALSNAAADIREERSQLSASIEALLGSVSTVKKLLEIWPAVTTHAPWLLEEKKALPAIPVASVLLAIQTAKQVA